MEGLRSLALGRDNQTELGRARDGVHPSSAGSSGTDYGVTAASLRSPRVPCFAKAACDCTCFLRALRPRGLARTPRKTLARRDSLHRAKEKSRDRWGRRPSLRVMEATGLLLGPSVGCWGPAHSGIIYRLRHSPGSVIPWQPPQSSLSAELSGGIIIWAVLSESPGVPVMGQGPFASGPAQPQDKGLRL